MDKGLKMVLIVGGIIIGVIVILFVVPGFFGGWRWSGYGWGGMMGPGMMGGYGTMFLMPILWIVVIGLIVWAVTAAVRRPGDSNYISRSGESALEILKRRYARGEINKQEYEERKKDLI
jgi:putative membrane protein